MHGVGDELELLRQRLTAVGHTDVWDVGAANVVALWTFLVIGGTQPVTFDLEVEDRTVESEPLPTQVTTLEQRQRVNARLVQYGCKGSEFSGCGYAR